MRQFLLQILNRAKFKISGKVLKVKQYLKSYPSADSGDCFDISGLVSAVGVTIHGNMLSGDMNGALSGDKSEGSRQC